MIGPVWMGAIAQLISWRWAFASEPLLIVLLLFFASLVTEAERAERGAFDSIGALLSFVGLAMIVLGATLAGEFGWWSPRRPFFIGDTLLEPFGLSAAVVFMLTGAMLLLAYAAWAAWRAHQGRAPLFRVQIFRNRSCSVGAAPEWCWRD